MLKKGVYENIINHEVENEIAIAQEKDLRCYCQSMDTAETPHLLANYLSNVIRQKLEDTEKQKDRVTLINSILRDIGITDEMQITEYDNLLTEVVSKEHDAILKESHSHIVRPLSGFRVSNLFTGGNSKISLGEEIRREIASADEICFIVSFLRLSGIRILMSDLQHFCAQEGKKLRIITTTYCGATEAKAVEQLSLLPNTEIRISYNSSIERLHAKSYIFLRHSGMHTAYIGSSNLSKSAQTIGLEWNVRVTSIENPHIIKSAQATFDMYWNSPNFEDFSIGGIEKFRKELNLNKLHAEKSIASYQRYSLLPHQKQILDKLAVEREEHHNTRNLVVAATGTGKTVISAFDYQHFRQHHKRSRLLFLAHREEILRQSLYTYRSVLRDANFGSLWVGDYRPQDATEYDFLFVSISMFNARYDEFFTHLSSDYYDYIVVDEAQHSQANSYRKLFDHFSQSKILLGLTATPERMDGKDLRPDFGNKISAEIRLPQALQAGLLTPFQYLCITDNVDLSSDYLWRGNKYDIERLSEELCSKSRVENIVNALQRYLPNEHLCKALCFCVNKRHADFTADELSRHGLNARSLTSDTPSALRQQLAQQLRKGMINYLCVVDIFNEGVDIPEIDTVLFLRPTESLTIFLQQLGRGLRLSPGKTELTVLDFVAQANKKYEFTNRFRALTLYPHRSIKTQVKEGFTNLPQGCNIIMEKKARQFILNNIQHAIYNKRRLIKEICSYTTLPSLIQFIENNGQDIRIIYQQRRCWTSLKREASKINYSDDKVTEALTKGIGNLIHHNSISFLHFVERFLGGSNEYLEKEHHTSALMLYYDLYQERCEKFNFNGINEALALIHKPKYKDFKQEMQEVVAYLFSKLSIKTESLSTDFPQMDLYGCYTREEIFTLVGVQTEEKRMQGSVAGVFNLKEKNTLLLFVTLNKSDKDFSPSTQYNDYLINEEYFHWQSQNTDSHQNRGGVKFLKQKEHNTKILLFVREEKKDGYGNTSPFHCFGFVDYISSHGNYPMNIKWKLQKPAMPQFLHVV